MVRHLTMIACLVATVACGGGEKKKTTPKNDLVEDKAPPPRAETEEDREAQRQQAATAMIPEDSTCLPTALKEAEAPRLELAAIGSDAVLCAVDSDRSRLLGVIGCWKVDLASGELAYRKRELPGRGVTVKVDKGCARGFCVPDAEAEIAHLTTNLDGSKTAVLIGDEVHIFDTKSKQADSKFSIRGDKGVVGEPRRVSWIGNGIVIEAEGGDAGDLVYVFKADGTAMGPITAMGKDAKPVSTSTGSFSVLDKSRVAISEQGFSTVYTYDVETGARGKYNRRLPKAPCKAADSAAYWKGGEVPAKCKTFMDKNYGHLVGADAVAGSKNLLVLLRGPRLGELAVLDAKTLAEKKSIRLPWCETEGGDDAAKKDDGGDAAKKDGGDTE